MKLYNHISKYIAFGAALMVLISSTSCSKLVEVDPPITSINGDIVFNDDATAIGVITGIYANMSRADLATGTGWLTNICFTTGLASDELNFFEKNNEYYGQFYSNTVNANEDSWANLYKILFTVNSAIEKLNEADKVTPAVKSQLLGESYFMRGFTLFYLVNTYGRVPMPLSSDYNLNRQLPRVDETAVYSQIVQDLQAAKDLLKDKFVGKDATSVTTERLRPTKWAAIAMLARIYLYMDRYADAETESSLVIANQGMFDLVSLDQVFKKNSKESIWQLQPLGVGNDANTREGQLFNLLPSAGTDILGNPVYLRTELLTSFDGNDQRLEEWIRMVNVEGTDYYYPYKYRIGRENAGTEEYSMVLRLAEQYLIRAEARIKQGQIVAGIQDLNVIRKRASNEDTNKPQLNELSSAMSGTAAILAVEKERRNELFTEWGHRWFDLKRTGRIDQVLSGVKSGWQNTDALFPIPQSSIGGANPNMRGDQNPGY